MRLIIWLASIVVAGGIGAYIGAARTHQDSTDDNSWKTKYLDLHQKFQRISEVDVDEYLRLKDQKEKYEKADEILAKILLIMLHDLGVRTSGPQIDQLKTSQTAPPAPPTPTQAVSSITPTPTQAAQAKTQTAQYDVSKLNSVTRQSEVTDFLKSAEMPDFSSTLQGGSALNQAQLDLLNGRFTGVAIFDDPDRAPWQVEIMFFARTGRNSLRGRHSIRLSRNGRQFSHTRGEIKDDSYVSPSTDSVSVIIDAYAGSAYFHVFYFPRMNAFYGNVYTKEGGAGSFKRTGTVHLTKM